MLYSGIDLHKDNCMITTVNHAGEIVKQEKVPNDDALILEYFFSQGEIHQAVVESTSNWYWLSDLLTNHNIDIMLAHAKYLKAIAYAKVKTDKVDSKILAQLLRMEFIPAAYKLSPEKRGIRDLLRARLRTVRRKVNCMNSINRIMEKFNITTPANYQFPSLEHLVTEWDLPKEYCFQLQCLLEEYQLFCQQIKQIDKYVMPLLIFNPDVQRLLTIPGIGKITAYSIYSEVDDISRFPSEKNFFSYSRVVPGATNSNRKRRNKSGDKNGNKYLKIAFTEAAVAAIRHYKEIRQFYRSKTRKCHKAIARNLVAKELARIAYHILKEKTEFKTFKGKVLSKEKSVYWPRLASPNWRLDHEGPFK